MKQYIILLFLMIFTISIFSFGSSSHNVNAISDKTSTESELCQNNNPDTINCNEQAIDETSPSYFSLMLVKEVVGGTASPDDFYLTVNGNPVQSGYDNFYSAGAVLTIDETQQSDYIFSSITGEGCPTQLNESFTLTQDTVCTITNIHCLQPFFSFTIIKKVVDGPASPDDFALTVNESPRNSGQTSYHIEDTILSIGETQQPNYVFSSITGDDCPVSLDEPFMLTKDITCTITNIFEPATLTVIKNVVNDDGGTNTPSDFTMIVSASNPSDNNFAGNSAGTTITIDPGAYSVTESGPGGYGATFSPECNGTAVSGESYTCTITNNDGNATLTVIKNVVNDDGGTNTPSDFTMIVSASNPSDNNFAGNSAGTTITIDPGAYSVTESGPGGYGATFSPECNGTAVSGESYTCTITNNDGNATLTVIKNVVNDDGGTNTPSDFTMIVSASNPSDNNFAGNSAGTTITIDPGAYSVTESGPGGYGATFSPECNGTAVSGESYTCTITNNDGNATLTVIKNVVNDDGGTNTPSDFTMIVSASNPSDNNFAGNSAGTTITIDPGAYSVTESGPGGYGATFSPECNGTAVSGESYTCTITNNDGNATLTVIKNVVNDDGGTNTPSDFTMIVSASNPSDNNFAGNSAGTTITIDPGAYSVTESGPGGYGATFSPECNGTAVSGESYTCTITNNDGNATLTVIKNVVNDDGGTNTPSDFTMIVSASNPSDNNFAGNSAGTTITIDPGAYSVTESGPGGYGATFSPECNGTAVSGESYTCTITNNDGNATLTVIKNVVNDDGGTNTPSDFTMIVSASNPSDNNFAGNSAGTTITIDPGAYSVTESGPGGYGATFSPECNGTAVSGESYTCTITNNDGNATLTVIKNVVNDDGGTNTPSDFTMIVSASNPSDNNFAGNSAGTTITIDPGAYSVTESGPGGYGATFSPECNGTAVSGESYTCTITNNDGNATLTVIKNVVNDDGGTNTPSDFTMIVSASNPSDNNFAGNSAGTTITIDPGAYSVTESGPGGYGATFSPECNGTAVSGESYTCTITNNDGNATLTVIKNVVNGTASSNDFALTVNGNPVLSGEENGYSVGTVLSLGETQQTGYFFSSITGADCPTKLGDSFTLTSNVTCTITNIFNPENDPIVFLTVNVEFDGEVFSFEDFILKIGELPVQSGQETIHLVNSTLSINETQKPQYVSSITGEGCPGSLKEPFTITKNTICTIIIKVKIPGVGVDPGGHEEWDTRPTFGVSHETRETQMVDNGFSFNDNSFQITDNHYKPFPEQTIEIGTTNKFTATVWADKGLKIQEFLFGVPGVGMGHLAEPRVEVWFDTDGKIDDIKIFQKDRVIDISRLTVNHEKTKCLLDDKDKKCDTTSMIVVFLERLENKVMAIKAIDYKHRDQTTYLNDGFAISGSSLNPMKTMKIPSSVKGEGLITVTQIEKYSPFWVSENERLFVKNNSDSFKQISIKFERFPDDGTAYTRQHSEFKRVIEYEQKRALQFFNATELISNLPESFSHDILIKERITDEIKGKMGIQEQFAKEFLEKNYVQARW